MLLLRASAGRRPDTRKIIRLSLTSRTEANPLNSLLRHLRRLNIDLAHGLEFDTPFGVTDMRGKGFAISTPICVAEAAALELGDVRTAPLPGPQLKRTLTLVSRRQELGALPRDLTRTCKASLEASTLTRIRDAMPWLADALSC
jgi:hypothetical protein